MKALKLLPIVVFSLFLTSCVVSKKKYDIAEQGRLAALFSRDSLSTLLDDSRKDCDALTDRCYSLMEDTTRMGRSIRSYLSMLANSNTENQMLNTQLGDRERTIAQLQEMIDAQNARVRSILDQVKQALNGFSSSELTVREEGGKVYVAMSDKLLFESGSAIVNEKGREALGLLSQVLNEQKDIDIYIEGHTDSVPIHTAVYQDNWDLSVIRSTSVVRILTQTYGVDPLQIQPCGRGEYKPVDTNSTPEGRARNRRTEIIIAPKLDKLYELLESN